jgi:hypothetical protein
LGCSARRQEQGTQAHYKNTASYSFHYFPFWQPNGMSASAISHIKNFFFRFDC